MTPYAFVYGPGPRRNSLNWPDFWFMQLDRRRALENLQKARIVLGYPCFRASALYTPATQMRKHIKLLHQGRQNIYY